jgi:membrane protein implicated in regulation of membrane protease activity
MTMTMTVTAAILVSAPATTLAVSVAALLVLAGAVTALLARAHSGDDEQRRHNQDTETLLALAIFTVHSQPSQIVVPGHTLAAARVRKQGRRSLLVRFARRGRIAVVFAGASGDEGVDSQNLNLLGAPFQTVPL